MLLTTKFLRPASDRNAVPRERLLRTLQSRAGKRLNLIIGPAGYGKTTLANQWCTQQTGAVGWLSLDANDDEPRRFWQYMAGALSHAGLADLDDCQSLFSQADTHDFEGAISGLINHLVAHTREGVSLVLDDYHQIQSPVIHRQLTYFIDYLPPGMDLVIVSRSEPELPVARWRVRQWADTIEPQLLAFSEDEARRFLSEFMALELDPAESRRIWQNAEGWVAAMQLSAIAAGTASQAPRETIGRPPSSSRELNEYIIGEILNQQPAEVRDFLLDTACCLRLNASLCNHVRQATDSQSLLERLSRSNLFLVPLDSRDQWFRYHDLFREALFTRLQQTAPERIEPLQARAIDWLLDNDDIQEAIAQLVQRRDWPWLERVLAEHGNHLIHGGFHLPVLEWLDKLPSGAVEANPRLSMLQIWGHFFANRLDAIEPRLEQLENRLDRRVADAHPDAEGALGLHSEIALIRGHLARTRADHDSAADLTRQVLRDIDHTQIPLKSVTYYGIGLDCFGRGDLPAAEDALASAVSYGQLERKASTVLSSGGLLAWIRFHRGHIDLALESCRAVRRWIDQHYTDPRQPTLISCWQNCALIEIHRERGELEHAEGYLKPLLSHLETGTEPGQHIIIQYARARLAFTRGDFAGALTALDDARNMLAQRGDRILFEPPNLEAMTARAQLGLSELDAAQRWLERRDAGRYRNPLNAEQDNMTAARVLIALGRPAEALPLLAPLRLSTEQGQHHKHLIEVLTIYADALAAEDKMAEASAMLAEALRRAARQGLYRLFVEESARIRRMIRALDPDTMPGNFLSGLQALLDASDAPASEPSIRSAPQPGLVEPLSSREIEVLGLINEGLANKDIAQRMQVANATVKAHIRNLYSKLQVKSRTEALARARQLALLQ
ncbi:LuxR C-terminal-related transcriptional regulator [Marinobacter bohaiensis]|uniref:LuxR C-terminal-related transcriptional regulator n=1 Tax=Marinobacter bohaiensis TaxID=2201898 RepID=UPI000DAD4079|nr:LuxR C-terminal-related transcriptional regulator [Marinobacter bohaiensis]